MNSSEHVHAPRSAVPWIGRPYRSAPPCQLGSPAGHFMGENVTYVRNIDPCEGSSGLVRVCPESVSRRPR
ncbi:hypothetical protein STRAU_0172 [Streptomyces aurantiacus JA 4570]|uniref:Uncharacterized protein n=1 Tax=Streptomyces aurantiacus JA 4570 TaxID=1286094 RepID=S3ZVF1_9ACTN|nr:hypothetical protein STRAU_0172 [Streptomyces aurantiacus JA 4570]